MNPETQELKELAEVLEDELDRKDGYAYQTIEAMEGILRQLKKEVEGW